LSAADLDAIDRIRSLLAAYMGAYPELMAKADEKGGQWSYLASDENHQVVRKLQLRNLIVPVTGDFAGTKAINSIAEYLKSRNVKTSVFYVSNVEGGLREQKWQQFYTNLSLLPFDSHGVIVRFQGRFVPVVCSAQALLEEFKNKTRNGFDPSC